MGGKKDGLSLSGKGLEDVAQVDARLRVEVGRRFIEQKNGWLVHKSLGEQGPLAHAPGERSAEGLHVILQSGGMKGLKHFRFFLLSN